MNRKRYIYASIVLLLAILFIALIPVDHSMENSVKVSGIVKSVSEGGVKDLVFELEDEKNTYYINRGLENGFNLATAKKGFEGKKVKLFYSNSWTPLAPFGTTSKHISHLVIGDFVYSEW